MPNSSTSEFFFGKQFIKVFSLMQNGKEDTLNPKDMSPVLMERSKSMKIKKKNAYFR